MIAKPSVVSPAEKAVFALMEAGCFEEWRTYPIAEMERLMSGAARIIEIEYTLADLERLRAKLSEKVDLNDAPAKLAEAKILRQQADALEREATIKP
ncbi:MAG: hypothetical protein WC655_13590 [Candidatus Hydrogenedentales bacterium]|jgi:hypothetical protein